jgi:dienelactone hydrolase
MRLFFLLCAAALAAPLTSQQEQQWRTQIKTALFVPDPLPPLDPQIHSRFDPAPGVAAERITYATQFGLRIPAILYLPKTRAGKIPALIVVNGHGGDKYSWYAFYSGILYARAGAAVLTYDPIGEGERNAQRRSGTRDHDKLEPPQELGRRMGGLMMTDLMQAVSYLSQRPEVDPRRIAAAGYSMGSFVLSLACAVETRLRACVLVGGGNLDGPGQYWDKSKPMCQGVPYQSLSFLGDRPAVLYTLHASRGPTLVYNGLEDTVVAIPTHGQDFFKDLQTRTARLRGSSEGVFETAFVPGASHRPYFVTRPVALWLERQLDFPNWTEQQIQGLPETHISQWAQANNVEMDRLYSNEQREGGTPALGAGVPALSRTDLSVFTPEEWEPQKDRLIYESWLKEARARLAPTSSSLPRARWLENGFIDAGGSHEPFTFVVRRGGQRLDAYQSYQRDQSEDLIRRLKEQGVEVFHTHLYKGAGMAHEKAEMEDARRVAAIAHRYGLKVDSYIQWNTMMYETFFAEEPRAQNWIQRDALGRPILLTYGFQQSFRYRPCFANQEYLDYYKRIVRFAVEQVKTDFIHFDNFDLNPEPDSCHCEVCVRGFREFLKQKYSPEKRKERFGFENVDYVNPPQWNFQNPPARLQIIFDPAIQEWIDYRCQVMSNALRQMALYAKSLNPEVAIEINPHGITGGNRAWQAGLDHARLLKWTEVFWTEEENRPGYLPDGRLISKIRSYKLARTFNNILLTYISGDPVAMAECLAFNQTIGYAGNDPLSPAMRHYIDFYRKHRELYTATQDASTVAVLRSYPSITYNNARAQLSAILTEQALIQARIPFDLIFDEHLADLSKYRVVILPDSECLSDNQLAAIRRFVANGGGLVATGLSGFYDEWRRLRVQPGLSGLIDTQVRARAYEERVGRQQVSGPPVRKEYEKGRVVYLSAVQFDGPLPEMGNYFTIDDRFWKLPKNWQEIADSVRWAARDDLPVQVSGPPFLVANLVSQPNKRRWLLHLVNYNARNVPSIQSLQVTARLPVKEVTIYSPDSDAPMTLKPTGGTFTIPEVKTYSIAVLTW